MRTCCPRRRQSQPLRSIYCQQQRAPAEPRYCAPSHRRRTSATASTPEHHTNRSKVLDEVTAVVERGDGFFFYDTDGEIVATDRRGPAAPREDRTACEVYCQQQRAPALQRYWEGAPALQCYPQSSHRRRGSAACPNHIVSSCYAHEGACMMTHA